MSKVATTEPLGLTEHVQRLTGGYLQKQMSVLESRAGMQVPPSVWTWTTTTSVCVYRDIQDAIVRLVTCSLFCSSFLLHRDTPAYCSECPANFLSVVSLDVSTCYGV